MRWSLCAPSDRHVPGRAEPLSFAEVALRVRLGAGFVRFRSPGHDGPPISTQDLWGPKHMARFTDRVAIVTGGGSGLGPGDRAAASPSEGAKVAVLDLGGRRRRDGGRRARRRRGQAAGLRRRRQRPRLGRGRRSPPSPSDLGRPAGARELRRHRRLRPHRGGGPEPLVNAIINVNLTGTFLMCRYTLPHLLDGGGTIVNIASNAGLMGQPFSAAYCASKGGVVNLTRALAVEFLDRGCAGELRRARRDAHAAHQGLPPARGRDFDVLRPVMSPIGVSEPEEVAGCIALRRVRRRRAT